MTTQKKMMVVTSPERQLEPVDVSAWVRGVAYFSIPYLVVVLANLLQLLPTWLEGNTLLLTTFIIQQLSGLLKKWYEENKYIQ